jgi:hypothetical protein
MTSSFLLIIDLISFLSPPPGERERERERSPFEHSRKHVETVAMFIHVVIGLPNICFIEHQNDST